MRLWKNGLIQLGLILSLLFLIGLVGLSSPSPTNQPSQSDKLSTSDTATVETSASPTVTNQATWNSKHISNYTMTVKTIYGAAGILDVQVVVHDNKIVDEKLLECEVGQPEYHAGNCEGMRTYYYRRGGQFSHTINDLFQTANSCLEGTKPTLDKYGLNYQLGFTGFTSLDAMGDFINAHRSSLTSSDYFCSVEYDAEYGYPTLIVMTTPALLDANGAISVKYFHVDD